MNLINTIVEHNFDEPEYYTVQGSEITQFSHNIIEETLSSDLEFKVLFMHCEFSQKKKFEDITNLTADVANIVNFPSQQCKISIHIGIVIK